MSAVLVSAVLDAVLGEPPPRLHPVVAMGRYLDWVQRHVPSVPPRVAIGRGAAACAFGVAASVAVGAATDSVARRLPYAAGVAVRGTVLWPLWSGRLLLREVSAVESQLNTSLDDGRVAVSRIVSRDTARLNEEEVRAAALESLAENLSDSVVAPLLWAALGGLSAAAAYRFVNTADAAWGYRTQRWLYAGRAAARADDLANLVPARLTAALLLAGAPIATWRAVPAQARLTPSPNAGWPMAALALRLDWRLSKPGVYTLNSGGRPAQPGDIGIAVAIARRVIAVVVVIAAALGVVRGRLP